MGQMQEKRGETHPGQKRNKIQTEEKTSDFGRKQEEKVHKNNKKADPLDDGYKAVSKDDDQ